MLTVGLDDHKGLFQPKWYYDSMKIVLIVAEAYTTFLMMQSTNVSSILELTSPHYIKNL